MAVHSLSFLALLAASAGLCRLAGPRRQVPVLLLGSAVFYLSGAAPWRSAAVLALSAAVTYAAARSIAAAGDGSKRRWLLCAAGYHLLVLGVFKYAGFLSGGAWQAPFVPLGLSFFTFQQIWYLYEVFTGRFSPRVTPGAYLTYCLFFPTVSVGPILRPQSFFPQLQGPPPQPRDTAAGLYALGLGLAKKVLLADNLGIMVRNGWDDPARLNAPGAWCVILGYTLQLYLDFSGCCDIAAGSARLLGLRLPVNFNAPYRSLSVTEFWKRWHITLTDFFREVVYFPLGGSRGGQAKTCRNILLVFLLSGIWHGAGWTFFLWGLAHGLAQTAERLLGRRLTALPPPLRWGGTFLFVNLAWVLFRAPSLPAAGAVLRAALRGGAGEIPAWLTAGVFSQECSALLFLLPRAEGALPFLQAGAALLLGLWAALRPRDVTGRMDAFRPCWYTCCWVLALSVWAVLSFSGAAGFIYADF